jgi:hypothetical protein
MQPFNGDSCYVTSNKMQGLPYDSTNVLKTGNRLIVERAAAPTMKFTSHTAYLKYKMAVETSVNQSGVSNQCGCQSPG